MTATLPVLSRKKNHADPFWEKWRAFGSTWVFSRGNAVPSANLSRQQLVTEESMGVWGNGSVELKLKM